jgi:hypothetical protein
MLPNARDESMVTHGICSVCAGELNPSRPIPISDYLDSLVVPVFLMEGDLTTDYTNVAARKQFGIKKDVQGTLVGEVFSCIHSTTPEQCGRGIHCSGCVIRNCIKMTFLTGEPKVMVQATLKFGDPDDPSSASMTITTIKHDDKVILTINKMDTSG